jgi:type IV pilus biogenesis/stability protein PilW
MTKIHSIVKNRRTVAMMFGRFLSLLVFASFLIGCVPGLNTGSNQISPDAQLKYQLGINYLNEGKTPQAIKELLAAQTTDPKNSDIEHALGLAYQQKQLYDKAIEQYNKALQLNPKLTEARNNYGTVLMVKGMLDEAIAQFDLCLKDPEYGTPEKALYNIGVSHFNKGDLDKAMDYYEKSLQARSDNINAIFNLAYCYETKKNYGKAIENYKRALGVDPTFKDAYYRLALVFNEQDNHPAALEMLSKVMEDDSNNLPAQLLMGQIHIKTGRVDSGIKKLELVAKAEPESELGRKAMEEISRSKVRINAKHDVKR